MVAQGFTVDLNKPLVFQVGHLGDSYEEWIHQAIITRESPRFFENSILELFTRTAWWAIPSVWVPVVGWLAWTTLKRGGDGSGLIIALAGGIFLWTFLEYSLHRFVFHMKPSGYWGNTLHYLIHGCHHKHPMDGLRLVFPPAATAILLLPLWSIVRLLLPFTYAPAFLGGGLLGYIIYDCTHYYLHHGKPLKGLSHSLKRYHMDHHFKLQDKGYGITSNFWDKIFGTLPPKPINKI